MYPDDHLMAALKKQAGQYLVGKIKEKGQTPLGLPYLFKRDRDIGMGWTPAMRNTFVGIENEWVEDGMTPEMDCALFIDHFFRKEYPVGYYGA